MKDITNYSIIIPGSKNSVYVDTIDGKVLLLNNDYLSEKKDTLSKIDKFEIKRIFYSKIKSKEVIKLWLFTTLNCDLNCIYCIQNGSKIDKNEAMSKKLIDQTVKFLDYYADETTERVEIVYFGGEPLMNFDVIQYAMIHYNNTTRRPIVHRLITNGYSLNLNKIKKLSKLGICDVQITIDGNKDIHNCRRITKSKKGTFDRIKSNLITLLNETEQTQIIIKTTVDKSNKDSIKEFIEQEAEILRHDRIHLDISMVEDINHEPKSDLYMSRKEFSDFYEGIVYYVYKMGIKAVPPYSGGCNLNYRSSIFLAPSGTVYRCPSMVDNSKFAAGNIYNLEFQDDKYNGGSYISQECMTCKFLFLCDGGCKYNSIVYSEGNKNYEKNCYYNEINRDLYNYYAAKYSKYLV